MTHRRTLLAAPLAAALLALLPFAPARAAAPADQAEIASVQTYLNAIHTLKARFEQVAPDGTETQGQAWLWRPGRMRFQYDPPSPLLLVANNGKVIFRDNQLDQTSTIPIGNTPLGILLAPNVDLTGGTVLVQAVDRQPGEIQLTLARAANPAEGQLALTFATSPLQLKSWIVTDAQHNQTKVSLFDLDTGAAAFDPALFRYTDPNLSAAPQQN